MEDVENCGKLINTAYTQLIEFSRRLYYFDIFFFFSFHFESRFSHKWNLLYIYKPLQLNDLNFAKRS